MNDLEVVPQGTDYRRRAVPGLGRTATPNEPPPDLLFPRVAAGSRASGRRPFATRLTGIMTLAALVAAGTPDRAAASTEGAATAPRPNIVLIVADDLGWSQPGFNGGTEVTTPNMDRIANEGVKLTQFYAQPQCAPTRAALLTGRYAWKNGVNTNPLGHRTGGILLDERTIAQALGDAGYATWIVGKWGVGHWRTEHLPLQRGFDHHYGTYTGLIDSFTHLRGDGLDWHRNGRPIVESGYSTFLLAEEAVQLIGRHDGTDPFLLYLSFNAVHTPHQAPREYRDLYSGPYYKQRAMLKAMDDAIGWVLAALESKGVVNDTLVMFLGDNGDAPEAGTKDQSPYRGEKATYFEGGIRVPAVARWPGEIPADSESDALLHVVDMFATFAELAGASTTDGLPLDGLDAWAAIAEGEESPRTELVHSPHVLRQGDWKLIEEMAHTSRWESGEQRLFNIAEDPYETTNLAETETAKVAEMAARLDEHEQFARANDQGQRIDVSPLTIYGEEENEVFGPTVWWTLNQRASGNTEPTLVRLEAVGDQVKLTYDEALYAGAAPPASAFDVVVNPGYNAVQVEEVSVSGRAVLLTLADTPAATDTVGLTYNVPDTYGIRDLVGVQAVGVTWVTGAVKSAFLSDDASLGALSLSGIDIGTFSSATTSYSAAVGNGISTTTVTATATHTGATVAISPASPVSLAEGANEITITVTAEDGETTSTYTVTVTRAAAADDATLSALSLSGIDIGTFSSATTSYSAAVGNGVSTTTVTATANHTGATVAISPASPVSLAEGANEITITVTAEDGETTSTYTVTVTRAATVASGDATLSALSLSGIDIGTFSSSVSSYSASVGNEVETTTVTATANHTGATVAISPASPVSLAEGANEITIMVTAEDGETRSTYTVTVTRAAPVSSGNATLSALSLSGIDIGTFSSSVSSYSASVGNEVETTTVTATATHTGATVAISPASPVSLAEGANEITITVTAEDGETTNTYTVTVTRASAGTEEAATAPRPNIVVIVADDMGWAQPGFNGGTEVSTPNIDRIANEGVKLTQFYVQPQCATTRGALLTGRYAWKNGVNTNPLPDKTGGLRLDERTIAQALGDVGYATWIVGKWHLGHWRAEHLPLQRGFDHHYGLYSGQIDSFEHINRRRLDWHRNGRPVVESGYSTFLLAEEAVQLIGRHDGTDPFFLYLPFNAVHTPHQAPNEYVDLYSGSKRKQRAMLKAMDDAIGWVLAALESKGVLGDTLVMFVGDNGDAPEAGTASQSPYRGSKATYFEGGIRVPAVVRWPDEITAGTESDEMLHVVDLFPTFSGLAGASTTDGLPLDGLDAWEAVAEGEESPRTELVHSPHVLRQGDWKLIERIAHTSKWVSGKLWLFNIAEDPYETTNLAETETAKVSEMEARLDHFAQFARANDSGRQVSISSPTVFGEEENEAFGTAVRTALTARSSGNTGPSPVRLEAVGNQVKLSFDEPLDAGAVPPASAFAAVVNPGYNTAEVEAVDVGGHAVLLTLAETPAATDTVGLTYNVPDTGGIRDLDDLEAAGVTWVTAEVKSAFLSDDASLGALSLSGIDIGTFSSATTSYSAAVGNGISTTTVTASASHSGATVATSPASPVSLATGANEIAVTVTAEDGLTTRTYTVTVTRAAAADDATLSALSLSGIDIGTFSGATTSYSAAVGNGISTTTVTATANHTGATVAISPASPVSLAEGANEITVTVTAEDGETTSTYTVTVTRAARPVVSIMAVSSPVSEGEPAEFRVTRTGSLTDALSVKIRAGEVDIAMPFRPGKGSRVGSNLSGDDKVVEDDVTVTWTILEDDRYTIAPDAASATVLMEDDDVAEFSVSIDPAEIKEDESATVEVKITNGVTFAAAQTIEFDLAGSTATKNTDYRVSPATPTLRAGARRTTATVSATADSSTEGDETVSLAASHDGKAIGTVSLTIKDATVTPLTAQFLDVPATHDGENAFEFELRFSEEFPLGFKRLRDDAFDVTGGAVRRAKRIVKDSNLRWSIRVMPASDADVIVALPATTDCTAAGAICTPSGKPLSNGLSATVTGPGTTMTGFSLAPENGHPSGIWSDGRTAWVADADDARLYAYRLADGARIPERDIATEPGPMGLWSDRDVLWVADPGASLRAHRLADGMRLVERDVTLPATAAPVGLWSDGETAWVTNWLGDTVRAYGLSDGRHAPDRDIQLAEGNLLPVGLWSDGKTLWVADWDERIYAYRLSNGKREPARDIVPGARDFDPSGLWSNGAMLLSTGWESTEVSAYRLPQGFAYEHRKAPAVAPTPMLADPALRRAVEAALGKASAKARRTVDLSQLTILQARSAGVRSLAGLEAAVSLRELDLGFNPLTDLQPLAMLPALVSLNLDGSSPDLEQLAPLTGLKRLSLRYREIESLMPLAGMTSLAELDVGGNNIKDLNPLIGLTGLQLLRANGNRIADLWPLAHLTRLETLDLGRNQVRDLRPLAGLVQLQTLRLDGNGLTELQLVSGQKSLVELGLAGNAVVDIRALSDAVHLQRLDLRGNPVADLWPLSGLPSLVWVHVGGSRVGNLAPLDGLPGLTLAGREDLEAPTVAGERTD